MSIKILSPKLTGTYIDYDSEKTLESIPDSVFSLDEFLGSDLFTHQEKSKHLQVLLDRGNYLLKLLDAYIILKTPLDEFKSNTLFLVEGMKSLTKIINDPLGTEFYDEDYGQALSYFHYMHPEQYYLEAEEFDLFNQVYADLDRSKRYTYNPNDKYGIDRVNFKQFIDEAISHFRHATEVEIGNLLTGRIFFSNRKQKATFVVDPVIFQVLNGGFRKSIRCNEDFIVTEEDRIERVLSLYNDISKFLLKIKEASSMIVNQIFDIDRIKTVQNDTLAPEIQEDDLEDIKDEKIRQDIRVLEQMYPKFKIYRKEMLKRGIISIDKQGLHWNYNQVTFVMFWAYCSDWKETKWKSICRCFCGTYNIASLKAQKRKINKNSPSCLEFKKELNIP